MQKRSADYREPVSTVSGPSVSHLALAGGADGGSVDDEAAEVDGGLTVECREAAVSAALHGQRLDKALVALAPEFSRSHLQGLLSAGHVRLDGQLQASASRKVRAGQLLQVALVPTAESLAYRPQPLALSVLYEDEHLLVLDKPAGLVVHPGPGNWQGTLLNGLLARDPAAASLPRAGIVHRLDKDTSGVMMVGRSLPAVTALVRAIAARSVHRRYLALAHGAPPDELFSIDAPIGRDPQVRVRMAVVPVAAGGRLARTHVQRLASRVLDAASGCAGAAGRAVSALSCTLETGRTHQIRVHLASRGHPLLADPVYGGAPALGLRRQALHATELRLAHPVSGQPLAFRCDAPPDFAQAWAWVQGGR